MRVVIAAPKCLEMSKFEEFLSNLQFVNQNLDNIIKLILKHLLQAQSEDSADLLKHLKNSDYNDFAKANNLYLYEAIQTAEKIIQKYVQASLQRDYQNLSAQYAKDMSDETLEKMRSIKSLIAS